VTATRIPSDQDYVEVAALTSDFLSQYFEALFAQSPNIMLDMFITEFISGTYILDRPVIVDYQSTGFFDSSEDIPTVEDLDQLLASAFIGSNLQLYLESLGELPPTNVFSTTVSVGRGAPTAARSVEPNDDSVGSRTTVLATLLAMMGSGVVIGVVVYIVLRKRGHLKDEVVFPIWSKPPPDDDTKLVEEGDHSMTAASSKPMDDVFINEVGSLSHGSWVTSSEGDGFSVHHRGHQSSSDDDENVGLLAEDHKPSDNDEASFVVIKL